MTNESTYGMGKHTPAATTPGEWMKEAERLVLKVLAAQSVYTLRPTFADQDNKKAAYAELLAHLRLRADTPAAPDMSSGADERAKFDAAILEATQIIRDHSKNLQENGWTATGEHLHEQALIIERAALSAPATPPTNPWKEAVIDQLALTCMDAPLDEPPASILKRVIDWNVMVALDPSVSEAAAALVASGATPPAKQQVGGQFDVVDHFTPPAPDQFTAGVNAAAAMLDKKADAYAHEHSTQDSDTGVWEFGRHGEDYYNTLRELADDVRSIVRGDPAPEGPAVGDLVLLVNRLAHSLKKANPDSDLPAKAADYLKRHSLGSSLRATPPAQPAPSDIFDAMNLPPVSTFPGVKP